MPEQKMSQAEFIKKFRELHPELKQYPDNDIIAGIARRRPDILTKVENPQETNARNQQMRANADIANAKGQANTEKGTHFLSTPALGAAAKSVYGYAKGAILDLPETIAKGTPAAIQSFVDIAHPEKMPSKILGAIDTISQMRKTYEEAGAKPEEFGRMLGQITGQAPVAEAVLGGFPKGTFGIDERIPSLIETAPKAARATGRVLAKPIRALGGPVERVGDAAIIATPWAPFGYKLKTAAAGVGLRKLGQGMKNFGISADDVIAKDLSQWNRYNPSSRPSAFPDIPAPPSSGGDVWGDALARERAKRFNFDTPEINALTHEFSGRMPAGTDLDFNPATTQEPHLPFGEEGTPTEQRLPLEGGQGLREEIGQISSKLKSVPIQNPNPVKTTLLREQGFEPLGPPNGDGSQTFVRREFHPDFAPPVEETNPPVQQSIPELQQRLQEVLNPAQDTPPPDGRVKLEGLSRQQIKDLKRQGYTFKADEAGRGWLEPPSGSEGGSRFGLNRILNDQQGAVGDIENDPLRPDRTGVNAGWNDVDWRKTWADLRQAFGRDPSAAEIEAAMSKDNREPPSISDSPPPSPPPELDVPTTPPSGQGQLFPMEMRAHNQLENISNAQNPPFELTPSPPGPEGVQHELNLEVDPKSEDPNQMRFKYRPMSGFRMADLDIFGQNLKEHNYLGSLSHGYASGELSRIPQGDPGLSVVDRSYPGQRQYDVNYRNPSGRAIAHAEAYGPEGSPLKVGTLAADKDAGALYGKSAFEVIKKLKDLGADGPSGLFSQHTRNLFDSLKRFTDDYPDEWDQAERAIRNAAKNARKLASGSTRRPDRTTNMWEPPTMGGNPTGGATSKMAPSEPPPTVDWEPAPEDITPTAEDIAESNRIRDRLLNPPSISPGSSIEERLRALLDRGRPRQY